MPFGKCRFSRNPFFCISPNKRNKMEKLPLYVSTTFILTSLLTLFFLIKATNSSKVVMIVSIAWLGITAVIGLTGFYKVTTAIPPRFLFLIGPPLLLVIMLFISKKGRRLIDEFDQKWMAYLHIVRVPVELVLFWIFIYKYIPQLMTFEGRNFDILSGITAPLIAYFGYTNIKFSKTVLLIWNFICLGLLVNIVVHAILSAPFSFQQLAFDQPNVAVFYFPFIWLPGFIVPTVLLCHLISIRNLLINY